jgi:DNA helicase-2/ATP-dependent DNA helicase PcrA
VEKLLQDLNQVQREAVTDNSNRILVLAGAGSGKTRTLTYRIAYKIMEGVNPSNILAVTFTNKAANEMRERIQHLVGNSARDIWIGTFHGICVRILARFGTSVGVQPGFSIIDEKDQIKLTRDVLRELGLDREFKPENIVNSISTAKNSLISPEELLNYSKNTSQRNIANAYIRYQELLSANNSLDFDDLLYKTVELLECNSFVREIFQSKFKHILIDEFQDISDDQYRLIELLCTENNNLYAVADDCQCLLPGTMISTTNGAVSIENLSENHELIVAGGHSRTATTNPDKIMSREHTGLVVSITTKSGKVIKATPEHCFFARFEPNPNLYFVYLMYNKDLGFRIGRTSGVRTGKQGLKNGYEIRLNQEVSDAIWILESCNTLEESVYLENYYSSEYGIPTCVFHASGRKLNMSQASIDKLFSSIDTRARAYKLARDKLLNLENPHHVPQATTRFGKERLKLNFVMFGSSTISKLGVNKHELSYNTVNKRFPKQMEGILPTNKHTVNEMVYYNGRTTSANYDKCWDIIQKSRRKVEDLVVELKAKITGNRFQFIPASHVRTGMLIPILDGDSISEEEVISVETEPYTGIVYDISVPDFRNYIANGVVVHNSIYSFRGADISHILKFNKQAKVFKMEQNYRSTKTIIEAANAIIVNNPNQIEKRLWTDNGAGSQVVYYHADDEVDEANFVTHIIKSTMEHEDLRKLSEFTVLYRTNHQARAIEDALFSSGIKYQVVGTIPFFKRKEVKDIIAYLKVIVNEFDSIALSRIINIPKRGIGKTTISKLEKFAYDNNITLSETLVRYQEVPNLSDKTQEKLGNFIQLINQLREYSNSSDVSLPELILEIWSRTEYVAILMEEGTKEARDRVENLDGLLALANRFWDESENPTIISFLSTISLLTDQDHIDSEQNSVRLMTIHTAKGLESPIVLLTGLEEGILPHIRASGSSVETQEERRLCYVGITRARERLYLTSSRLRTINGVSSKQQQSRFLKEIPSEILKII